jgi:hypothetical protein
MSWKFWKKDTPTKPSPGLDQIQWPNNVGDATSLLVGMFMQRLPPFASWKSPTATVPAELDPLVACSAWGFQLSLWFAMLTSAHGQPAADVAKEMFLEMLGHATPGLDAQTRGLLALSSEGTLAYSSDFTLIVGGKELEMPLSYFLAIHFLTRTSTSPYFNRDDDDLGDITLEVAKCLDHANQAAIEVFVPMHKAITSFSTEGLPHFDR